LLQFSLCTCRRHYPGEAGGCLSFSSPPVAAFPVTPPGQPSHRCFRGLLNVYSHYSPHTRGVALRPFPSEASDRSLPSRLLQLLPAGTTLAGRDLHPLKNRAFPRHTAPEPHGFAVRPGALVSRAIAATASHLTFMRIAKRPSWRGGMARANHTFPKNGSEIFFHGAMDRPISLKGLRKLDLKKIGDAMALTRVSRAGRLRNSPSGESKSRSRHRPCCPHSEEGASRGISCQYTPVARRLEP
jgi:hypothetical protein